VVGAKVVCLRGERVNELQWRAYQMMPDAGAVYTIRDVIVSPKDSVGLLLNELHNAPMMFSDLGFIEPSYFVGRFRPLVTRTPEQDAAQFRKLLNTTPVREDA
jgi:hypothetical protein